MIEEDYFTYNRKRRGPRIEHDNTPYFNVSASE